MNTRILIFGINGLLGRYLNEYLKIKYDIIGLTRKDIDIYSDYIKNFLSDRLIGLLTHKPAYIINCIGITNKRPNISIEEMYIVNSYFPMILSKLCNKHNIKLIHPSTDCIYNGKRKNGYPTWHNPNCCDHYGISKALAEEIHACIIRVSIIGEDPNKKRSLIEWVKSNKNGIVDGYIDHHWNGITCLEYAKFIEQIIEEKIEFWIGVKNVQSFYKGEFSISKYQLVKDISDLFNLNIDVKKHHTTMCDRTLIGDIVAYNSLEDQLTQLKDFDLSHFGSSND